ncbi:hypothetical protein BN159_2273 [Streptomyces davaonensis JCM 4913]|uniref:Uncharacterized protein n=1 Tax=Streptomyces davaonensis (strain DSM 101723 / JCM 4913 / KCC S-0913 / 768) TaxID=1214101 RepID=K4R0G2_STRDJ|nr:hypothetical protein [Streptomyces davaonensis]CCK26652.1 hypothetical protein BN159_2273 [Streptomyces davaonensis JCM 4913]
MTDHALRTLRQNPRLAELAAFPFEFDLSRADGGHGEPVRLASGGPIEVVAGTGAGGTYFVCADGSMLYADSEGGAGIIGSSVDEALQVVLGLPCWFDFVDLSPRDGEEVILARIAAAEEEMREDYGIDETRAELRAALGFPERSPVELVTLLHTALLRTEPDFVLLTEEEGFAYRLLDEHPRPPLWEPVLARGRADLTLLRTSDRADWDPVAGDPVRRRLALRAAQFDRAESDLDLLRYLLRRETESSMTDELRLAAVLVGRHGDVGDLPLLYEVRETDFDTHCGLSEIPEPGADAAELLRWAEELDEWMFGTDPADEPLATWTELALDQGMTELARVALIRALDEVFMDQSLLRRPGDPTRLETSRLSWLAAELERAGDLPQALRAQRLHTALQETAWDRISERRDQARLERVCGQLPQAIDSLAAIRALLADPGDDSLRYWTQVNFGRFIAEEHYALTRALVDADLPEGARTLLAAADAILGELSGNGLKRLRELAEETAERVRDFRDLR